MDFVGTIKSLPNKERANLGFMVWIALWLVAAFFMSGHGLFYYAVSILSGIGLFIFVYSAWNMTKGKKEEPVIGWIYLIVFLIAAIFWILVKVRY